MSQTTENVNTKTSLANKKRQAKKQKMPEEKGRIKSIYKTSSARYRCSMFVAPEPNKKRKVKEKSIVMSGKKVEKGLGARKVSHEGVEHRLRVLRL